MTTLQYAQQEHYAARRRQVIYNVLLLAALSVISQSCGNKYPSAVRPKVGALPEAKRLTFNSNLTRAHQQMLALNLNRAQQLLILNQALSTVAPGTVGNSDPAVCLSQGASDPSDKPLGGRTSIAAYTFPSAPHIQDMYATLYLDTEICSKQSLSTADESRLQKVLAGFGISKAQAFVANLSLKGDAQGGISYPQLVPFSYSFDTKTNKFNVSTVSVTVIPWQATTAFEIGWSYSTTSTVTIGTATLFSNIVTDIAGAGGTSRLLSPAANGFLAAGDSVAQRVATALSNANVEQDNPHHFDLRQGPDSPARSVTYRFRDLKNQPLAGVRLVVAFTNSLLTQDVIDPMTEDSTHTPHFSEGDQVCMANSKVCVKSDG